MFGRRQDACSYYIFGIRPWAIRRNCSGATIRTWFFSPSEIKPASSRRRKVRGKRFTGQIQMAGDIPLETGQGHVAILRPPRIQEVVGNPAGGVAEDDIFQEPDEVLDPQRQTGKHSQAERVVFLERLAKQRLGQQDTKRRLDRFGRGRHLEPA